ncbi:MAG: DUF3737 family protein [Muribaculum sp.]|nr:DUF3737 family protein [Muribaculum sp.]
MKVVKDTEFGGERPLFGSHDLRLDNVVIHAGESALKECSNIEANRCRFEGKYPFWHVDGFVISDCLFTEGARAALWYSRDLKMTNTLVEAPKMFREMHNISLDKVKITNALETLWDCTGLEVNNVEVNHGDYIFMRGRNIRINSYCQQGNYSFQKCKNVEIRNAKLDTKDAFWETEDVTVYDSEIDGEYLGWHSKRLHLIRCHIKGTQPLCYAEDLVMEDCTMDADCDLAFEYSTVKANIKGHITSIKNPKSGTITADSVGEIILDENIKAPADCKIIIRNQ